MKTHILRLGILFLGLAYLAKPATVYAQVDAGFQKELLEKAEADYRNFFKPPVEVYEYWSVIEFEMSLGKFELAGFFIKKLVEKEPKAKVDEELLRIQQTVGLKPFFRLGEVKIWSQNQDFDKECRANAAALIKRIVDGIERTLSDPERIKKYVGLLNAPTKQERDSAYAQLMRSGDRVIPYLLDTIRSGERDLRNRAVEAFIRMDKDMVDRLFEILRAADDDDAKDVTLRRAVMYIFRQRADFRCIPYLWHISSSPKYALEVREAAKDLLGYFHEQEPAKLPAAKFMLTQLAEKCFQHKLQVDRAGYRFWRWDGKKIAEEPEFMPRRKAEYFFGLRFAREALDLDPTYKPAQTVFLNLVLERTFDSDLDKYFFKPMVPRLQQLLLDQDPQLLLEMLERALDENNVPIALPLIDILGQRGELRAAQPSKGNQPRGLVRSLYYSDRRVQFAAVNGLLKMPYRAAPADSLRVVDVLRRFVAADSIPRTLVAMCPKDEVLRTIATFKVGGFESVEARCSTLVETFEKLRNSADYDIIFIHPAARATELPYLVSQLRADSDYARTPLIILSAKENVEKWRKLFERHPNTWVELDTFLLMPEGMKKLADEKIGSTSGGYLPLVGGFKLSVEERKKFNEDAMKFLWQMGKKEIPGYSVLPAQDTLRAALRRPELAKMALETAALNPDRATQNWLANVFFDRAYDNLKLTAITELRQHILKNGLSLEKHHIANLKDAQKAADNPEVNMQLTLILANLRFSPQQAGKKLNDFDPPVRP